MDADIERLSIANDETIKRIRGEEKLIEEIT